MNLVLDNLPKFCLSRNGAHPKFKVLVHFCWLDQIYSFWKHKILLKSDFMFSCCFYVFLKNFCAVRVDIKQGGGQISNVESTYLSTRARWAWGWLPQRKNSLWTIFQNFVSKNGAYSKFKFLVHFWLDQIYPLKLKRKILLKIKTFQKTRYILRNIDY